MELQHSLNIYSYNKCMNMETMCESAKLEHQIELSRHNTLFENYETFSDKHFVTCNTRKIGNDYLMCFFWIKKKVSVGEDVIFDFSIKLRTGSLVLNKKINYYKKYKKFLPIRIKKWEDSTFIHFDLIVIPYGVIIKPYLILDNCECNICYEMNKSYYIENPFICSHNEVCLDCINNVFKTNAVCPICRALVKPSFI